MKNDHGQEISYIKKHHNSYSNHAFIISSVLYCHKHHHIYNITFKEVHSTIGEPWPQIITNWVSTTGTSSIRGELQETNLSGLKSK